jgi:hypothetical protein
MKKFVLGPVLAALAMFLFGAIYWMSPFPYKTLKTVADNSGAALALAQIFPETGTYLIPGVNTDEKQVAELFRRGPLAEVQFVKEGHEMMEPMVFLAGFVHYFVVSLLLAALLAMAASSLPGYWSRVRFCALAGIVGSVLIDYSDPIWWHHPWAWHIVGSIYSIIAFTVAGLVLAAFATPPAATASPDGA